MCRYFDLTNPSSSPSLFGQSPLEQAQVKMWHRIVELQGLFPAMQAFRNISGIFKDRENVVAICNAGLIKWLNDPQLNH